MTCHQGHRNLGATCRGTLHRCSEGSQSLVHKCTTALSNWKTSTASAKVVTVRSCFWGRLEETKRRSQEQPLNGHSSSGQVECLRLGCVALSRELVPKVVILVCSDRADKDAGWEILLNVRWLLPPKKGYTCGSNLQQAKGETLI